MLFKGIQLCIPRSSMRLNLIKEIHSGGLVGHFGIDKTLSFLKDRYYWPQMYKDVQKFVRSCGICKFQKKQVRILDCIHLFLFLRNLGVTLVWILFLDFVKQ